MIGYTPFLGQVRLVNSTLGLPQSAGAVLGQQPAPTVARFIVTDQLGGFIPGVKVSIILDNGTLLASKQTDKDGKVAFDLGDINPELEKAGFPQGYKGPLPTIRYTVEAPGYAIQGGVIPVPTDRPNDFMITLKKASDAVPSSGLLLAGAVLLGVGVAVYLGSK